MAVTLFAYWRGTTSMHRIPASAKLLFLMTLCICTFMNGPHALIRTAVCFAASIVLFVLSGAHKQSLRQLAFVPVLGALVTLFGTICLPPAAAGVSAGASAAADNAATMSAVSGGSVITLLPFFALNLDGLRFGILYTVRFFTTALAAQVIFETTSSVQIKDSLESLQNVIARAIPPIKKMNPAFVISLALNFIPQVFETWNRVSLAARARSSSDKRKKTGLVIRASYLELQALLSCMLYQAETTRKAVENRSINE